MSDPVLRRALSRSLEKRVPASEIDDLVQATLLDAFAAPTAPRDETELRRWVYGILRNKIANHYRARRREVPLGPEGDLTPADSAPRSARDLLHWAEKELPEGEGAGKTLDWMLEEADGEKLETIARAERVPATRIRQRVARLRRYFRERWAAQLAGIAASIVIAVVIGVFLRRHLGAPLPTAIAPEPSASPEVRRADQLRRAAFERCARRDFEECLRGLDRARALDPAGDLAESVRATRSAASAALVPAKAPSANDLRTPAPPSSVAPPVPAPVPTAVPSTLPGPMPTTTARRPRPLPSAAPAKEPPKGSFTSDFSSEPPRPQK